MFYDCYNGCLYHRTCPEHENWSRIHGYCDWDYNVDCGADPGPPGPDDFVCPEAQGVFEDPKNCAKYYRCSNFHATRNLCHSSKLYSYFANTYVLLVFYHVKSNFQEVVVDLKNSKSPLTP